MYHLSEGRDYEVLYRVDPEGPTPVLDIMKVPFLSRHRKTMRLEGLSFSEDHKQLLFGVDLNND